ncbi:MAG: rhomboid family intramembrane serine protease [Verrucomicrobia bacterium]|nr:MAG: rhomboid family intramembrane serine protease [Verrucomicrobiota bacterium]
MFPLSDDDRMLIRPAWVTHGLMAANIMMFLYQLANPAFTMGYSMVPYEMTHGVDLIDSQSTQQAMQMGHTSGPVPIYLTLLFSMFMHGGWAHLGGNMLYLWIFGDNVEHRFGHVRFLAFYLLSGLVGSLCQIMLNTQSVIPNLGASGAISGILGAYLVLFPRNQVMAIFLFRIVQIPALWVLGLWVVMQIFSGFGTLSSVGETGGVAYGAHLGGFFAGLAMGIFARIMIREEPDTAFRKIYDRQR